jgi:hypothetical protein
MLPFAVRCTGNEWSAHRIARSPVLILKTVALFVITAIAEIVGCYLPYLWLKKNGSHWLLIPVLTSLALFAWLYSHCIRRHPGARRRPDSLHQPLRL